MSQSTDVGGYVLFRLAQQTFATPLDDVREIVRLEGLERLPGAQPPLAGVIVLRGSPLPVLDVRGRAVDGEPEAAKDAPGDVLVMDVAGDTAGVAVDAVVAVLRPDELPEAADTAPRSLPSYVVGVRRHAGQPVLLVDVHRLLDLTAADWAEALATRPS
jgi:purine-binding chemotaxis protein CheW